MNIKGIEENTDKIESYLQAEIKEGGLLEDVEKVITGPLKEGVPEPPYLWITEEPIRPDDKKNQGGQTIYFKAPILITGAYFDFNDVEKSYKLSKNLVTRAWDTLSKQFFEDPDKKFRFLEFSEIIPDGAEIQNGSKRVSQSILIVNAIFRENKICRKGE